MKVTHTRINCWLFTIILSVFPTLNNFSQQAPYGGNAWSIPGLIEIEDFDVGGEGIAYHDATPENAGNAYRLDEGVDIQSSGDGGFNIGWTATGEWLEYTIDVKTSMTYTLKARVASPNATGKFRMEFDGVNKSGTISVPNTGNWQDWVTIEDEVTLDAGEQIMRIYLEGPDFNFSWIKLLDPNVEDADEYFDRLKSERVESDSLLSWEQVGPGNSGFANLLRYHSTLPNIVAFCPDMINAYQTDNNGTSWYSIKDFDGSGDFSHLRDLYYSPSDAAFGLALEGSHLWATHDTGKTWEKQTNCPWYQLTGEGLDQTGWKSKVAALAIDPNNDDIWYVGGGAHVRGQEWLSSLKDANAANPHGATHDFEGKIWKTINAGTSWTEIATGLNAKAQAARIVVNPKNSSQVFAATSYGLYRSDNGGASWADIGDGELDNNIIMDMDFYYNAAQDTFVLYVIDQVQYLGDGTSTKCTGGIFRTTDNGDSWVNINGDLYLDINKLTGGVPNNYSKYINMWLGAGSSTTYPDKPTKALQYFNMLSVDPSREGALYIGFADPQITNSIMPGRIWTTSDDGESWINTARLYGPAWENDKAYWEERGNPYNANMAVGHQSPAMQFGNDYPQRSTRALSVGVDGSVMMVADHSTMLSTDHGVTWNQVDEDYTENGNIMGRGNSNLPGETLFQDKRMGAGNLYLPSGEHHMFMPSHDGTDGRFAVSYNKQTQETVSSMATDPLDHNVAYTTSFRQNNKEHVFRTTDGGRNWSNYGRATPVSSSVWNQDMRTHALTVHPLDNTILFFGVTDKPADVQFDDKAGFYFSDDQGKTFSTRNTGLPTNVRIRDIEFDPRDNSCNSLFVAAEYYEFNLPTPVLGGLYHTTNLGESWTEIDIGPVVKGVNHIDIDNTGRIYVTTGYRGSGAGLWYSDDYGDTWINSFKVPNTLCIDVSPFDNNLLVISVDALSKNPGIYISEDRGVSWSKNNRILGIPNRTKLVEFDLWDPSTLWLASVGCGFYKGTYVNGARAQALQVTPGSTYMDGEEDRMQLTAKILNDDLSASEVTWESDNPSVASVDSDGNLIPLKNGLVKIVASIEEGRYSDNCWLTVTGIEEGPIDGLNNLNESNILVYPNPVENTLNILNMELDAVLSIYDMSGAQLMQVQNTDQIDFSGFSSGLYLLKIRSGNEIISNKIMKR